MMVADTANAGFAIGPGEPETMRQLRALRMGAARGWWTMLPPENPSDPPNRIIFRVNMAPVVGQKRVVRRLPAAQVLPWVLGVADREGVGDEFTYQEGL